MKRKSKEEKISLLKQEKRKQEVYELKQQRIKKEIKSKPHHFWGLLWYYIKKPFVWIFDNIKDWRTAIIFLIIFLLVSSEVWVSYLLAFISWGTTFSKTMLGVASACWAWWLLPVGSPFMLICISLTILVKGVFNKIRFKKIK